MEAVLQQGGSQILKCVNFLHLSTFLHILYAHLDNFTRNLKVMRYVPVSHDTYLKNNGETTAERLVYLILTIYGYTFKQKETFCVSIPKAM